jgi:SAM-dependent methyltransferase
MKCRHCDKPLQHLFLDLGYAPPSNAYLSQSDLSHPEKHYPLRVHVCSHCWLVQTEDYAQADELFNSDYAYFSSTSSTWLRHAADYAKEMTVRLGLGRDSFVLEVASNDGYLLRNFVAAEVPCLGIEPTASTAAAAEALGVPVLREFFGEAMGRRLAQESRQADLIVGNNVYAHVPDINDFTRGLKAALKPDGVITLEFPHVMELMANCQFDTVYHEHFSYLSLTAVSTIFQSIGLRVWDVERISTHGGSLRVYGCHLDSRHLTSDSVASIIEKEEEKGLRNIGAYLDFQMKVDEIKNNLLDYLIVQKKMGQKVVAYGAAAKGNTILNYAGVRPDLLGYVFDAAKAKQGRYMPGSHIQILDPAKISAMKPDRILILPWNISEEIVAQLDCVRSWGAKFVVAFPNLVEF